MHSQYSSFLYCFDPVVSVGYFKDTESYIDTAVSDEDVGVQMMISLPFQF